jgi:ribonuclease PH
MSASPRAGRGLHELRTVRLETGAAPYAEGSCLVSFGSTRVLCAASVQENLPDWRKGARAGWVTAEYAMLPRATHKRTPRERGQVGGRTQEIQRLVGRALRACIDLEALGERSIVLDCDVLGADGGTRTAAITGAAVALHQACTLLLARGAVARHPMNELVAAISVGIVAGEVRLDLEYVEDVNADVDLNIVALETGRMVEIQGTAEHAPFDRAQLDEMIDTGTRGIRTLLELQRQAIAGTAG